jgi:hypothetical protein
MLRMPEDIRHMLNEWAARQRESNVPVEKPKELQDYLEERRRIIEKAEANGCMIG